MKVTCRFLTMLLCVATMLTSAADVGAQGKTVAQMDKARMAAAVKFGETVLKYGRDTYGETHTPLFTDLLDVDTMKAPEKMYINRLGHRSRPGPRKLRPWQPVVSSNLSYQCNLMRFLAGLSNLIGDAKYKEAYKDNLRYYFEHYQIQAGVLRMGHHCFIDLKADHYDGDDWPAGERGHEMKGDLPYYDLFWEVNPQATARMLMGHWNCHIKNWDNMEFTRHGYWNKKFDPGVWDRPMGEPVQGMFKGDLTFFGSGSDIIWAGVKLAQLSGDEKPLKWAKRLFARYVDNAHPKTGIPPCHHTIVRQFGSGNWQEYALYPSFFANDVFGDGATRIMRMGDALGEKGAYFSESVHKYLKAYAKYAYNPKDNILQPILYDGTVLPKPEYSSWPAGGNYMLAYALCYRQSKDKEIWDILQSICRGNDLGDIGNVGGISPKLNLATSQSDPVIIFALIEMFNATDNRAYLNLARLVGNNVLKQYYNAEKGLFVKSELHKNANLNTLEPLAFVGLQAALTGKGDKVPTYAGSYPGQETHILRPTKVLPYNPIASFCYYADTVEAICDELLPANSNDRTIPLMSWYYPRHGGLGSRQLKSMTAIFPDILNGPVSITALADSTDAVNWLTGIIIDSPFSYDFTDGQLRMTRDFTVTVLQGDHKWQGGWQPSRTMNYILDIAAGARFTFMGVIFEYDHPDGEPSGLVKNGPGTAVVTADYVPLYNTSNKDNRAYRRDTVINDGVLLVNNSTGSGVSPKSSVQVNNGGTLGGRGTIGTGYTSAVVNVYAGGTIAPGGSVGTLTVKDGLTLHDGAKLALELGRASDLLKVTSGTLTGSGKGGVSVSVTDAGGLVIGKTYNLIDWTGTTLSGVDVGDFVSDKAGKYVGKFSISGNMLQITITGLNKSKTAKAIKPTKPKMAKPKISAANTWINPSGGNWSDRANWYGGVVPNGPEYRWVQYSFEKPRKVSSVDVYWFDDKGANCVPASWRLLYRQAGKWKPVENPSDYGVAKDRFNKVSFKPIKTDGLKLEVKVQPDRFAGILEWRVNPK